jgi:hypothetical protein
MQRENTSKTVVYSKKEAHVFPVLFLIYVYCIKLTPKIERSYLSGHVHIFRCARLISLICVIESLHWTLSGEFNFGLFLSYNYRYSIQTPKPYFKKIEHNIFISIALLYAACQNLYCFTSRVLKCERESSLRLSHVYVAKWRTASKTSLEPPVSVAMTTGHLI